MRHVTYGAVKDVASTTAAAFASSATWLVGMLAIMASHGMERAHTFQAFVLA